MSLRYRRAGCEGYSTGAALQSDIHMREQISRNRREYKYLRKNTRIQEYKKLQDQSKELNIRKILFMLKAKIARE